jgi:hypothetical protein
LGAPQLWWSYAETGEETLGPAVMGENGAWKTSWLPEVGELIPTVLSKLAWV